MDPTIGTDNVEDTPVQLAAEKNSVELSNLFAKYGFPLRGDGTEDDVESKAEMNQNAKQELLELIGSLTPGISPLIILVSIIALVLSFVIWKLIWERNFSSWKFVSLNPAAASYLYTGYILNYDTVLSFGRLVNSDTFLHNSLCEPTLSQ